MYQGAEGANATAVESISCHWVRVASKGLFSLTINKGGWIRLRTTTLKAHYAEVEGWLQHHRCRQDEESRFGTSGRSRQYSLVFRALVFSWLEYTNRQAKGKQAFMLSAVGRSAIPSSRITNRADLLEEKVSSFQLVKCY